MASTPLIRVEPYPCDRPTRWRFASLHPANTDSSEEHSELGACLDISQPKNQNPVPAFSVRSNLGLNRRVLNEIVLKLPFEIVRKRRYRHLPASGRLRPQHLKCSSF